ncbi:thioredoxin family protein [Aquimarina sp. MAR_2010_214]|uniref:thioredoxin family protein n=1 Tax=Aquimarina sp. MAR_2010_214 TaxID=1250026 RepID=UPI00117780DB|nr:thioredoxin family protein [Aquimarina sp. MAR_2010_214]
MKTIICVITSMILSIITLSAQSFNHEIKAEGSSPMLLGKINNQGLTQDPYNEWFSKNYKEYTPKQSSIDSLKTHLSSYTITLFMGTWCGDSKREVPRLYKILKESNFPLDRLTTIAVDRSREAYKQSPGGEHEGLNIHRVPTLIFYKDGKEVNRIVESPKNTLEEDILAILSKNYTPKYSSVILMNDILTKNGASYIFKNTKKLVKKFKDKTQNLYELNTYASVLFYDNRKEEAIAVLDFNTALFPKEANTYVSLANKYLYMDDTVNAIQYYKKSLEFEENKEIQNKIKELSTTPNVSK